MDSGYHTPIEEYLETIQTLRDEGSDVIGARIAERLGRSAPSVKEMLDRLEEEGYLERVGRSISLTERGDMLATTVVRRHRLAERLLVDVIGLEWYKVHAEAGRWEHVISQDVEDKLVALLGDPATCPHGNPIPGSSRHRLVAEKELSSASVGEVVVLSRIGEAVEHDQSFLEQLDQAGFIPGRRAHVAEVREDGTVEVRASEGSLEMTSAIAASLYVVAPSQGEASKAP